MNEGPSKFSSEIPPDESRAEKGPSNFATKEFLTKAIMLLVLTYGGSTIAERWYKPDKLGAAVTVRTINEVPPQTEPTNISPVEIAVRVVSDTQTASELTELEPIDRQSVSDEMIQLPGWTEAVPALPKRFGEFKDQSGRTVTISTENSPDVPTIEGEYREILISIEGKKRPLMDPSRKYPILVNQGALWNWNDQQMSLHVTFHHLRPVGLIYDLTYQWNGNSMELIDSDVNQPKNNEGTNPGSYLELRAMTHSDAHPTHHRVELEKAKIFWDLTRHGNWDAIRQIYRKHGIKNESYIDGYILELQKQLQEHNTLLAHNINSNYFEYRHSNRPFFMLNEHIGVDGLDLKNF